MTPDIIARLAMLELQLNAAIDILIKYRDNCASPDKATYRYITRKIEQALTKVHEAQEKIKG